MGVSSAPGNARRPLCPYKARGGPVCGAEQCWGRGHAWGLCGGGRLRSPTGRAALPHGRPQCPRTAPDLSRAATRGTARSVRAVAVPSLPTGRVQTPRGPPRRPPVPAGRAPAHRRPRGARRRHGNPRGARRIRPRPSGREGGAEVTSHPVRRGRGGGFRYFRAGRARRGAEGPWRGPPRSRR